MYGIMTYIRESVTGPLQECRATFKNGKQQHVNLNKDDKEAIVELIKDNDVLYNQRQEFFQFLKITI